MNRSVLQAVLRRVEWESANGPQPLVDAELLRRFAVERHEASFAALVARHGPLVWAVCRNLLPNEADAEDAFQATFLALVQSAAKIRKAAVGAWLHGVAMRAARLTQRSAARRKKRERRAAAAETDLPIAGETWSELQTAVHEEVGRLPEALRIAFVLCDLQGRRQQDVAVELGWKSGTLSGRLCKARRQLLERLAKRGIAVAGAAAVAVSVEAVAGAPLILTSKAAALARAVEIGPWISPSLLELARAATEVTMSRTKFALIAAAACCLLAAGVSLLPWSSAQPPATPLVDIDGGGNPGQPDASSLDPRLAGRGASRAAAPAWEYKCVVRQTNLLDDFKKALSTHAAEGWEYVGTEMLQASGRDLSPVLVFKRPTTSNRSGPAAAPAASGGMMPGDSGPGGLDTGKPAKKDASMPAAGDGLDPLISGSLGMPVPARRDVQIIALKHITATSLAQTLHALLTDGAVRIVAETQSNSLLIHADQPTVDLVKTLVQKLDVPAANKSP